MSNSFKFTPPPLVERSVLDLFASMVGSCAVVLRIFPDGIAFSWSYDFFVRFLIAFFIIYVSLLAFQVIIVFFFPIETNNL